jgi:hypothetical protein
MCPACLASAVWVIGGVLSATGVTAGGLAAAAAKLLPGRKEAEKFPSGRIENQETKEKGKEQSSWQRQ